MSSTRRSARCSRRSDDRIANNARALSFGAGTDPAQRLAPYLDGDALRGAVDAALRPALVIDEPGTGAQLLAERLRSLGAFAHLDDRRLVVIAGRNVLADLAPIGPQAAELLRAFDAAASGPRVLRLRERSLDLVAGPAVMGILNVTPDSFHDRYRELDAARSRAFEMVAQGASIVDVGGQSYAAGNPRVAEDEERRRVVPVIEALVHEGLPAALSVDTARASVAQAALAAGAHLVNDCSGLADSRMEHVVAAWGAGLVAMHLKGELNVRSAEYEYEDALAEITDALRVLLDRARAAGVPSESLVADPGLEFGKEPPTDLEVLDRFGDLRSLGVPLLLASSRKSFLGRLFARPARDLLVPSLATAAQGILAGADIVRTHDVAETVDLARTLAATRPNVRAGIAVAGAPS